MTDLGELLNTIDRPVDPCPGCKQSEPMQVYANAVRWRCGHIKELPPLGTMHGPRPAARITPRISR